MSNVLQTGSSAAPSGAAGLARGPKKHRAGSSRTAGILFVAPWLLGLTLFYVGPMVATLIMSFTNYKYGRTDGFDFIGLKNWNRLLHDPHVTKSIGVTFKFAVVFVPISMLLPLGFAYLLTSKHLWGRSFFRAGFFLPAIVPGVSGLFVWRGFLNGQDGWLNRFLGNFGISGPDWLTSSTWIIPSYGLIATWGVGNAILIFISALNGVPKDLYEAARLDGAGALRIFRNVTMPMISPITFYNLVLTLVALGQYFLVPFVLNEGTAGTNDSSLFYTLNFYRETFKFYDAGYGSALAWGMFVVIMALTGLIFWSQKYWVHYEFEEKS